MITFSYVNLNLAEFIISLVIFVKFSTVREKSIGTIKYSLDFFLRNFILAIFFDFFCFLIGLIDNNMFKLAQYGIFNYFILYFTLEKFSEKNLSSK